MDSARLSVSEVRFDGGHRAKVVRRVGVTRAALALDALSLRGPLPVLVLNGGTSEVAPDLEALLAPAMRELVEFAKHVGAILVTGGTDAGIFRILGEQLQEVDHSIITLGVAPDRLVSWPGRAEPQPDAVQLEPHHTHFVLTVGRAWSDETPVMLSVILELTKGGSSAAVLAGGGAGTRKELHGHLSARRPVAVLWADGLLAPPKSREGLTGVELGVSTGKLTTVLNGLFGQPADDSGQFHTEELERSVKYLEDDDFLTHRRVNAAVSGQIPAWQCHATRREAGGLHEGSTRVGSMLHVEVLANLWIGLMR